MGVSGSSPAGPGRTGLDGYQPGGGVARSQDPAAVRTYLGDDHVCPYNGSGLGVGPAGIPLSSTGALVRPALGEASIQGGSTGVESAPVSSVTVSSQAPVLSETLLAAAIVGMSGAPRLLRSAC